MEDDEITVHATINRDKSIGAKMIKILPTILQSYIIPPPGTAVSAIKGGKKLAPSLPTPEKAPVKKEEPASLEEENK